MVNYLDTKPSKFERPNWSDSKCNVKIGFKLNDDVDFQLNQLDSTYFGLK